MAANEPAATLAAFRRLPKEASNSLRERSMELASTLAVKAQSVARGQGRQAPLVAPSIKARRDRVPVLQMGGSKRVGRNRAPVYRLMYGAEFGSNRFRQFGKAHTNQGYFFFPTVHHERAAYAEMWQRVADDIGKAWVGKSAPVELGGLFKGLL